MSEWAHVECPECNKPWHFTSEHAVWVELHGSCLACCYRDPDITRQQADEYMIIARNRRGQLIAAQFNEFLSELCAPPSAGVNTGE